MVDSLRERRLEDAVARLSVSADWQGVIRLVEAWAGEGAPTPRARLYEGRAFLRLRLMDRALMRAREANDALGDDPDALRLLAEVYVERGWPLRARKPLTTLRSLPPTAAIPTAEIDALWARSHADPPRPEAGARDAEREADPPKLLALAEAFLATGSFLRGTGILERLKKSDPDHPRVRELLWGIAGDFSSGAPSLDALLAGPAFMPVAPTGDFPDDAEHTESVRDGRLLPDDFSEEAPDETAFPALFKYGATPPPDEAEESSAESAEATVATGIGAPPVLQIIAGGAGGDTQIMQVIGGGEADGPLHRRREAASKEPFNLRQWQSDMGVRPRDSDLGDADGDRSDVTGGGRMEEEDENVVLVHRESPASEPPRVFSRPIEVVEKHPVPVVAPRAATVKPAPPAPLIGRGFLWIVVVIFLAATIFGGVILLSRYGGRASAVAVRLELLTALASGDYQNLLEAESRFEQRGDSSTVRAALAETRLVLWSEFNGDPARIDAVHGFLQASSGLDVHRLAMLRAAESYARGDVVGAGAALGRESARDDEERLLVSRIEDASGDRATAEALLAKLANPDAPRYRLALATFRASGGHIADAQSEIDRVLRARPEHFAARLLQIEWKAGTPAERVAGAEFYLQNYENRGLAPRFEGRAHLVRARAYAALGMAGKVREATQAGLARDGANPELLYLDAADLANKRELVDAAEELRRIAQARRGDAGVRAAQVTVLLDVDRVDEAAAAIDGFDGPVVPVLRVLVSTWGRGEPPPVTLDPPALATPLGAWAGALLAVQQQDSGAWARANAAADALAASTDPFELRLAPRARTLVATLAPVTDADRLATAARAAAPEDPFVHLFLGRWYESTGRKALAAQHFDRAALLGAQAGLALYEKGRFYRDAGDDLDRSGVAWRDYLALAPTGPRANRVKDSLGVR